MIKILLLSLIIITAPVSLFAGRYTIAYHDSKSAGMGFAGISLKGNIANISQNPASLARLSTPFQLSFGMGSMYSTTRFQYQEPSFYQAITNNPTVHPFYAYAGARIGERLGVGLALYTPVNQKIKWQKENWVGRYLIQQSKTQWISLQPTIGYQVTERISFGAGFIMVQGTQHLQKSLPVRNTSHEGSFYFTSNDWAMGFTLGLHAEITDMISLGIGYQSEIEVKHENVTAHFEVPTSLSDQFPPDNLVSTSLQTPARLEAGVSASIEGQWLFAIAVEYIFGKSLGDQEYTFLHQSDYLHNMHYPRNHQNRMGYRLGIEYTMADLVSLRLGGFFKPMTEKDTFFSPDSPVTDMLGFTSGISVIPIEGVSVDLSFVIIRGLQQKGHYAPKGFGGSYKTNVLLPGAGISYYF